MSFSINYSYSLSGTVGIGQSNGVKMKEGKLRSEIGKKFFTLRVLRQWNRFLRELVTAPALAVLKARVDKVLSNLD